MDTRNLIDTRETRYGSMADNAGATWRLMEVFEKYQSWGRFTHVQKHLFYMTAHKMARMLCGDPNYIDNYDDIIGYWTRARDFVPHAKKQEEPFELLPDESWKAGTPEDGGHHGLPESNEDEIKLAALEAYPAAPSNLQDFRDGVKEPPDWKYIGVCWEGIWYYLVDRNHYSEGAIEHLSRLFVNISTYEHKTLPPYYRALYTQRDDWGFSLKENYVDHWSLSKNIHA